MKNKIKQLTKIGILLFGISVLFIGCEKDDTQTLHSTRENPNVSAFKITTITNQEVKQNENLYIELEKIRQQVNSIKSNALNRTVYSTEYDFSIDTENVTYIENSDASYHSYTFPIFRTSQNELIENLLLSLQKDGRYKAFIVTYNLTEQEQESIANNEQIDLTDKASFTEINSDNLTSDIFSRTVTCGYSSEWTCWEEACPIDGCWDPQYTITHCNSVLVYNDDCDLEIGGGSGGTDGSNSNGGGSTGNTNTNTNHDDDTTTNTNVTSPNIPTISDQIENCINGPTLIGDTDDTIIPSGTIDALNLNRVELSELFNYLITDNGCSDDAQDFTLQAVETIQENGDVDFENGIIIDSTFNNSQLHCIHKKMKTNDNLYKTMLSVFENTQENSFLTFKTGVINDDNFWGITKGSNTNPNEFTITIKPDANQLSNLAKEVILTHELIHAFMYNSLENWGLITYDNEGNPLLNVYCYFDNINYNNLDLNTLTTRQQFVAIICAFQQNNSLTEQWIHDVFNSWAFDTNSYRDQLKSFLIEEHDWENESIAFKNNAISVFGEDNWIPEVAGAVSWIGLQETQEYLDYFDNYFSDPVKAAFISNIVNEIQIAKSDCNE